MSRWLKVVAATALLSGLLAPSVRSEQKLLVHEWSVFTVLEDESGKAIGGINIDDVSIAETLHRIAPGSLLPVGAGGETVEEGTRCHSDVTMRMEKAVVNFYPAANSVSANAEARSGSGWLTQFYPAAEVKSPGFSRDHIGSLSAWFDSSSLSWGTIVLHPSSDQTLSSETSTEEEANPLAARIEVGGEEADGLILRGVSYDYRIPLRVVRDGAALRITEAPLEISQLWLVETRADGNVGLRVLHPSIRRWLSWLRRRPDSRRRSGPRQSGCVGRPHAVSSAGERLFAHEVEALLETLRRSQAGRFGMRLFFLAPAKSRDFAQSSAVVWIDEKGRRSHVQSTRAAVGCIEVVTPEQRSLLARIAAGGEERSLTGHAPGPESLGEERWEELRQMYEWLGQFRNALLLDEQRRRPSPILAAFIKRFHLEGYTPERDWPYKKHTR